jgi:hypothetical protein
VKNSFDFLNIVGDGINFTIPSQPVLPKSKGKYSDQNEKGLILVMKNLPKETVYYTQDRTIKDWHGYDHDVTINMPYQKYPRAKVKPNNILVKIIKLGEESGKVKLYFEFQDVINKGEKNWEKRLIFLINLSLELFGSFDLVDKYTNKSYLKIERTNWQILPPGEYPFEKIKSIISSNIDKSELNRNRFDLTRLDFFDGLRPDFQAIGFEQFRGYVVFGFRSKNKYILDNSKKGNAIYMFVGDWEDLSKKTKKELITQHNDNIVRVIHKGEWKNKITKILNS